MKPLLYLLATNISPGDLPGAPTAKNPHPQSLTSMSELQTVLSIIFGIIGGLALLIIVVSGFRYITSAGDPDKVSRAKNGIIYALIGLVIAISAEAIVVFVVGRIT